MFKELLSVRKKSDIIANLKQNWCFLVSAMAFFSLYLTQNKVIIADLIITFVAIFIFSSQVSSIIKRCSSHNLIINVISILCAIGVCWFAKESFCKYWGSSLEINFVGIFGAVAGMPFVYFCNVAFWNYILSFIRKCNIFKDVKLIEWIIYILIITALFGLMVFSFSQSQAFYKTNSFYDIIYTSDSPNLVKENVYLNLMHAENNLRQPLFAVFASPFAGIPYLFAKLIKASACTQAMFINSMQIVLLVFTNFVLAKMLKLDTIKRICFMLLTSCTYTNLLFSLMMEQYVIAYFWLIICMYLIVERQQLGRVALWGAGGTMITSMVLLPFTSDKSPVKNFKAYFLDMLRGGFGFVAFMLIFCRFDVFASLKYQIFEINSFTGQTVTFTSKIYQYTEFIKNCFTAPNAGVVKNTFNDVSWQMNIVKEINFIGILIFVLCIVSALWNRDKKNSLLAAYWIGFSVITLFVFGWGTKENGLTLYSLYFGWAFVVLLFQLLEKIEDKLKIKFLIPITTVCVGLVLLTINIPAIIEMIDFAITYYPV